MKKPILGLVALLSVLLVLSGIVVAGTKRSPTLDTTCANGSCTSSAELVVSTNKGLGLTCTVVDAISYIKWDLTANAGDTIAHAQLTLTSSPTDGIYTSDSGTYTFALVEPNNHTWTAGGSDPGYGNVLATSAATAITPGGGESVGFQSDALGAYFNSLKGGTASVGVIMTDGCESFGSIALFEDDGSTNEPDLIFYTGPGATAITLASLTAASAPAAPLALFAGVIGLAALALVWMRRR